MGAPEVHRISGDITRKIAKSLNAGDQILYSGIVLTARDAAHKRLVEALDAGEQPPIDIDGAVIYYAGPAPAKPGYAMAQPRATVWTPTHRACSTWGNER